MSQESGLLLTTQASTLALPKLSKVMQLIKNKNEFIAGGNHNELPSEIELGQEFKFHNVFICPVSKEMSTKDNNPMLLVCGHVISKNSLNRIARSNSGRDGKFKCHTCPTQMTTANVVEIKINNSLDKW